MCAPGTLFAPFPPLPCTYSAADPYAKDNSFCPKPLPGANASSGISQCPANGLIGSTSVEEVPCPAGRYQPYPQASSYTQCLPCSLGTYGFNTGWP